VRRFALLALLLAAAAQAQEKTESLEMLGHMGARQALLSLYGRQRPDGSWRVTGEYLLLPGLQRRFLEGERGPQLGVTFLKEGTTPILWAREPTATLQGTWREGRFSGTRYGPGGQVREKFEFSDEFPPLDAYSGEWQCKAGDGRYDSSFAVAIEAGRVKPGSLQWRSTLEPSGHGCALGALEQRPFRGGLRLAAGRCAVTLRDLGEAVKIEAEDCAESCASQGYLEPILADKRGGACRLLRPQPR